MAEQSDRRRIFSYLEDRFGIPERIFDNYLLFRRRGSWQLINQDAVKTLFAAQLKVSKVGLRAFQKIGKFVKPTTRFIQLFGSVATKARLEIDEGQLRALVAGEELSMDMDLETGYVILSYKKKQVLGLGFFINGKVRSQIPKKQLRRAMLVH